MQVSVYKKLFNCWKLLPCGSVLRGLGNTKTIPVGLIKGEISVDKIKTNHEFLVVEDINIKCEAILGYDFISKVELHSDKNGYTFKSKEEVEKDIVVYNIDEVDVDFKYKDAVETLIKNYVADPASQSFSKNKEIIPITMKIIPNENMKPFRHSPSRLAMQEEDALNKQVEEWLQKGVVRRSTSDMASRVVVVKKKCGDFRICIDFRQLNKMVLRDCFPVPIVDDVLQKLKKAKFFTVMDLRNGFFHVPIDEASKKYTAFVTKRGFFEFNRAPFGFCNSPACFVRYVNHIFQDLKNNDIMELYVDDIIIYDETAEGCLKKLEYVLQVSAEYGLDFNWRKCCFMKNKIEFLGHVVQNGTLSPGPTKCKAVENFPLPKNIKDIQAFLGLTGYFRKFVKGYAQIVQPLTDLLRKNASFTIGDKEIQAIEKIKHMLINEPVLGLYDRDAETEVHTDASKNGFGATILQKRDDNFHPILYWSKKATPQENRLHSYILEVKAAYLVFKKFRHLLLGINFTLVTDCAAFRQTVEKKDVPRDVAQWIMYLQDFSYTVVHKPANRMRHVDCLSRFPVDVYTIHTELTARLRKLQQTDEHVKAVTAALQLGSYDDYKLRGGLVYKYVDGNDLLLVPKSMESEIIRGAHETGHFAAEKTMHAIKQRYYIPHLQKKVEQCINNCVKSIIYNKKLGKKEGYLQLIDKGDTPLCTIHVDHLGPLDITAKRYKYILAMIDGFSKFVWLFPTRTTNADEVVKNLKVWSETFGYPRRIISDRGSAFTSVMFGDFCREANVEHVVTTTGVPRGNGQVERLNRTILSIISKVSSHESSKWFKYVGQVQQTINSCVHSTTKSTPFEVLFGKKMKMNIDDSLLETLQEELVDRFDENRQQLRQDAKLQIAKAQERQKNNYDKNRKDLVTYKVGDLIAIKRTQFVAGKKLSSEYLGPYEVTKVKRSGRYDVVKAADFEGPKTTSTSCDFIKPWRQVEDNTASSETDDIYQDGRM